MLFSVPSAKSSAGFPRTAEQPGHFVVVRFGAERRGYLRSIVIARQAVEVWDGHLERGRLAEIAGVVAITSDLKRFDIVGGILQCMPMHMPKPWLNCSSQAYPGRT